jgi:putative redox protein
MSVEIVITSTGGLNCQARHGPSGATVLTTAPVDNGGDGSQFSPTDLVATALGSCILTIMALAASRHGLDLAGTTVRVEKEMSSSPPRRIAHLAVAVTVPVSVDPSLQRTLERAAAHCPVSETLGDRVEHPVTFTWA